MQHRPNVLLLILAIGTLGLISVSCSGSAVSLEEAEQRVHQRYDQVRQTVIDLGLSPSETADSGPLSCRDGLLGRQNGYNRTLSFVATLDPTETARVLQDTSIAIPSAKFLTSGGRIEGVLGSDAYGEYYLRIRDNPDFTSSLAFDAVTICAEPGG